MADANELQDLRRRLALLRWDDQLYLFELLLGDYRRKEAEMRAEAQAQDLAAAVEILEAEARAEIATLGAWYAQQASGRTRGTERSAG